MKTQLFKARDMKTAMNLVNDEYGDKAIILSTKRNNGVVEVEASDNDKVIETHKKKVEEKKNFSKVFNKEINIPSKEGESNKDNISYIGKKESNQINFDDYKTEEERISKVIRCIINFFEDESKLITGNPNRD